MLVKVCFYERPLPIGKGLLFLAKTKGGWKPIAKRWQCHIFGEDLDTIQRWRKVIAGGIV
jgi:hypothetical protein